MANRRLSKTAQREVKKVLGVIEHSKTEALSEAQRIDLVNEALAVAEKSDPEVGSFKNLIDTLENVLGAIYNADKNKDGNLSWGEKSGLAMVLIPLLLGSFGDFSNFNQKWNNLDSEEIDLLLTYASMKKFFPSSKPKIQEVFKLSMNAAVFNKTFVESVIKILKED